MATGYDTLQQAVADAQKNLNDAKAVLVTLQNDPTYIRQRGILADPRVQASTNGWIDGSGVFWQGNDAAAQHSQGAEIVRTQNERIATQQTIISDAQLTLKDAQTALANYEKNSPIGQQAAANLKDAKSKQALIVTVMIIAVVVVGVSMTVYFIRKGKKKKTE